MDILKKRKLKLLALNALFLYAVSQSYLFFSVFQFVAAAFSNSDSLSNQGTIVLKGLPFQ